MTDNSNIKPLEPSQQKFIYDSNSQKNREYHNYPHSKGLSEKSSEVIKFIREKGLIKDETKLKSLENIIRFAALYHDIYQLGTDGGYRNVDGNISDYLNEDDGILTLNFEKIPENKKQLIHSLQAIFKDNEELKLNVSGFGGANEFLSTMHAVIFEENLNNGGETFSQTSEQDLLVMGAIIEATRPFQDKDRIIKLVERLEEHVDFGDEKENMLKAIRYAAAKLSNHDVGNFIGDFTEFWRSSVDLYKESGLKFESPQDVLDATAAQREFFETIKGNIFHSDSGYDSKWGFVEGMIGVVEIAADNKEANITIDKYGLANAALMIAAQVAIQFKEEDQYQNIDIILSNITGTKLDEVKNFGDSNKQVIREEVSRAISFNATVAKSGIQKLAANIIANLPTHEINKVADMIKNKEDVNHEIHTNVYLLAVSSELANKIGSGTNWLEGGRVR